MIFIAFKLIERCCAIRLLALPLRDGRQNHQRSDCAGVLVGKQEGFIATVIVVLLLSIATLAMLGALSMVHAALLIASTPIE